VLAYSQAVSILIVTTQRATKHRLHHLVGGTPTGKGIAVPPIASLGAYGVIRKFKRRQSGNRPESD